MTGSTEMVQRGNIEVTQFMVTGLEYDAEYEVKLFAVNEQGDSKQVEYLCCSSHIRKIILCQTFFTIFTCDLVVNYIYRTC